MSLSSYLPFDAYSWFLVPARGIVEDLEQIYKGQNYNEEQVRNRTKRKNAEAFKKLHNVSKLSEIDSLRHSLASNIHNLIYLARTIYLPCVPIEYVYWA